MMGQTFHDIRPLHQLSRDEHGGTLEKPPENGGKNALQIWVAFIDVHCNNS